MNERNDLALQDVSFSYDGAPVLEHVSFRIRHADFACIVGPNGGGKTTLLKLMLGLVEPDTGRVEVLGTPPEVARERIGYMPQHAIFDATFPVTVIDVVLMGRLRKTRPFGPYSREDKRVARRVMDEVDIGNLADRPFSALSGGQRQRALIARAMACEPEMLFLDEPTASLDVAAEQEFYDLLRRLNERMTLLVVSHDLSFVSSHVRTVICVGVEREVHVHPTHELNEEVMHTVYGRSVRMIRHERHDECEHGDGHRHPDGEVD